MKTKIVELPQSIHNIMLINKCRPQQWIIESNTIMKTKAQVSQVLEAWLQNQTPVVKSVVTKYVSK